MKRNTLVKSVMICAVLFLFTTLLGGSAYAVEDRNVFFQFGGGLYMPSTDGWDDVYNGDIIPYFIAFDYHMMDSFGLEFMVGYYGAEGETIEGPGYASETVDFQMIPFTVTGFYRYEMDMFIPYAGAGIGAAYYRETSDAWDEDFKDYSFMFLVKGGSEVKLSDNWRFFAELSYSMIPIDSDENSASGNDADLGGLGLLAGFSVRW